MRLCIRTCAAFYYSQIRHAEISSIATERPQSKRKKMMVVSQIAIRQNGSFIWLKKKSITYNTMLIVTTTSLLSLFPTYYSKKNIISECFFQKEKVKIIPMPQFPMHPSSYRPRDSWVIWLCSASKDKKKKKNLPLSTRSRQAGLQRAETARESGNVPVGSMWGDRRASHRQPAKLRSNQTLKNTIDVSWVSANTSH